MKLAVLCSDDAHHAYLIAQLAQCFTIGGIVVEPAHRQRRQIRMKGRYRDWLWAAYHALRRRALGLDAYRLRYFGDRRPRPIDGAEWLCVDSVNDAAVVQLLTRIAPDITIVMGTGLLKTAVIEAAGVVINIHGGFLPHYRGNHCIFFALYEEAYDRIGSTIHFVDAGIDTGDIIDVVVPPLSAGDNAEKLYCRAEKQAIHRLVELLRALEDGSPLPRRPQGAKGRLYRTRDRGPWHDIRLKLRLALGITRIPA